MGIRHYESQKNNEVVELRNELLDTKLALAELAEQREADRLANQLAMAELIEIIEGGTVL